MMTKELKTINANIRKNFQIVSSYHKHHKGNSTENCRIIKTVQYENINSEICVHFSLSVIWLFRKCNGNESNKNYNFRIDADAVNVLVCTDN